MTRKEIEKRIDEFQWDLIREKNEMYEFRKKNQSNQESILRNIKLLEKELKKLSYLEGKKLPHPVPMVSG